MAALLSSSSSASASASASSALRAHRPSRPPFPRPHPRRSPAPFSAFSAVGFSVGAQKVGTSVGGGVGVANDGGGAMGTRINAGWCARPQARLQRLAHSRTSTITAASSASPNNDSGEWNRPVGGAEEGVAGAVALAFAVTAATFTFRVLWITFLVAVSAFKYVVVAALLAFGVLLVIP